MFVDISYLVPSDTLVNISQRVREPFGRASLAADEPIEVGSLLVTFRSNDTVALSALGLENFSSLGDVSHYCKVCSCGGKI